MFIRISCPQISWENSDWKFAAEKNPAVNHWYLGMGSILYIYIYNIYIYTWYPKQPCFNGCLVKQPFFM